VAGARGRSLHLREGLGRGVVGSVRARSRSPLPEQDCDGFARFEERVQLVVLFLQGLLEIVSMIPSLYFESVPYAC